MGLYEVPKKDIVWIKAGHPKKHTPADARGDGLHLGIALDDRAADNNSEYGSVCGVFGETKHGWFRIHAKTWKTKRTPISYNNATKTVKYMGFNGKYYSFKLKPAAFTKAKKIIDSYNKKWDEKKKTTPKKTVKKVAKRKTTTKRKTPVRKTATKKKTIYRGKRKSPSTSATSVRVGTKMRGGDGKMYVCKTYSRAGKRVKRWVRA